MPTVHILYIHWNTQYKIDLFRIAEIISSVLKSKYHIISDIYKVQKLAVFYQKEDFCGAKHSGLNI